MRPDWLGPWRFDAEHNVWTRRYRKPLTAPTHLSAVIYTPVREGTFTTSNAVTANLYSLHDVRFPVTP